MARDTLALFGRQFSLNVTGQERPALSAGKSHTLNTHQLFQQILTLQRPAQRVMRQPNAAFGGLLRTAHHFGNLAVRQPVTVTQDNRFAQARRQPCQRTFDRFLRRLCANIASGVSAFGADRPICNSCARSISMGRLRR